MRQERARYDEIYTKLENDVRTYSREMAKVLEKGQASIKARDKAVSEYEALVVQLEQEKAALAAEQEELSNLEEHFRLRREEEEQLLKASRGQQSSADREATVDDNTSSGTDEYDEEQALDEALAKIKLLTGTDEVELIQKIEQREQLHFGLFCRISELEEEAVQNEIKIADAQLEVKQIECCAKNSSTQKQKELEAKQSRLKHLEERLADVEAQHQAQIDTWECLRSKIMVIHNDLGLTMPEGLIGDNDVSENNALQYLGAIEKKTTEILSSINGDYDDDASQVLSSPSFKTNNNDITLSPKQMELPSTTDHFVSGLNKDDGERPYTFAELQKTCRH